MLKLTFESIPLYDEATNRFIEIKGGTYTFKHSLYAIAKWEAKWLTPFLVESPPKTPEQLSDYFKMMTNDEDFNPMVMTHEDQLKVLDYMKAPMSATKIYSTREGVVTVETADTLYASLFMAGLDIECQHWHINRLFKVLGVIGERNSPPKKMSASEIRERNIQLNAERKAKLNTKG